MIIYLIRHARQESTLCNVNVPLAEEGKRQAELLGKRMQKYPLDALYTSDLIRAVQTARIAFKDCKELLEQRVEKKELREFNFGSLTGVADGEVKAFYKNYYEEMKKKMSDVPATGLHVQPDFLDMEYPEGENGKQVFARVWQVIEEMIAGEKQHIAVVTHGGVIRVLMAALFGKGIENRLLFGTSLENCGITQIHYDKDKQLFYLDRFNDYAHLEEAPELLRHNW